MGRVPGLSRYGVPQRITADAVVKASPGTLMAVQLDGGTDASSMIFHNDVDDASGTPLYSVVAPSKVANNSEQSSVFIDLQNLGGIHFDTGCFVNWTGTAAVGYVWFASD